MCVCLSGNVQKLPTHLSHLEIFRKKIFFSKKLFFSNSLISILINEKNNSIVLLFYCFMGNAQKISTLEIFRKKIFFSKYFFFQNSLKSNIELKKNISIVLLFYCVMGNAQKISTLEIYRNFFFQMCVPNLRFGNVWRSSRPIFFG